MLQEPMPSKRPAINVRLDPDVKDAVAAAAAKDGRSASNFLERMVIDWLRAEKDRQPQKGKPSKGRPS
jgi:uncharacterized protein (DUF1778 family)